MTLKEFKIQYALGSLSYDNLLKLAIKSNTFKGILNILSENEHGRIRYCVADNITTPMDTLLKMSKAENENFEFIKSAARTTIRQVKTMKRRARKRQNKNSKDKIK